MIPPSDEGGVTREACDGGRDEVRTTNGNALTV